jgi:DNA-binding HxlR family transcriptional regulator
MKTMEAGISEEVRQFVAKYIRTLDQLEVLLLVSALPDREWSATEVYNVVMSSPAVVTDRLESLVHSGMLSRTQQPPVYRYQPKDKEMAQAISAVAAAYKLSRHRIVELIYSLPRSEDPMTNFSDAFKFKRKD